MTNKASNYLRTFIFLTAIMLRIPQLKAQPEVMEWGNITGIRVDGQLMEFETSIRVVGEGWGRITSTGKERQRPRYKREGDSQIVNSVVGGFAFKEVVKESGTGSTTVSLEVTAEKDTLIDGVYYCIDLPVKHYSDARAVIQGESGKPKSIETISVSGKPYKSKKISIESEKQQLTITLENDARIFIRQQNTGSAGQAYIELMGQEIKKGARVQLNINITVSGIIDRDPAEIVIDPRHPGRRFDGFGGNFRLQNPKADPKVIQYCLDSMRVAWGRVEMPWSMWHPEEDLDPVEYARSGKMNGHVQESMIMAQILAKRGIPVILSAWFPPKWAIVPNPENSRSNIRGNALNPGKMEKIYKSICDYITYLKNNYGVEPVAFSFNESDLGIDVRQTGEEHRQFIKGMGEFLSSRGLETKLLLGDNSDATTFSFILPALKDPETHRYISAVSFHSWRGCDEMTLKKWAGAAKEVNLPLIIAEGSTDAAAWNYPDIFFEQTFALNEINLYIRICSLCQPLSILQWQLTSDYSVLKGEGIFRTTGPLTTTTRFWNLRQLASTPANAFSIPVSCNNDYLNCAAFGNIAQGKFAVHIVNNGAGREAEISGFPPRTGTIEIFITDKNRGMEKSENVTPENGRVKLILPPAAMISLISKN